MKFSARLFSRLHFLISTFYFLKKHFAFVILLGMIAAFGRVLQLGGFGTISNWQHVVLEVIIEAARIILFVFVLGFANVGIGLLRLKHFFTRKRSRKKQWITIVKNAKRSWPTIALNIIAFFAVALFFNYTIDLLAYETCLYLNLKEGGLLSATSSEWTILLFFKNLSVIPFTLVFEALLILWLTNKLTHHELRIA